MDVKQEAKNLFGFVVSCRHFWNIFFILFGYFSENPSDRNSKKNLNLKYFPSERFFSKSSFARLRSNVTLASGNKKRLKFNYNKTETFKIFSTQNYYLGRVVEINILRDMLWALVWLLWECTDSWSKGWEFKSQEQRLNLYTFHNLFVAKLLLKRPNINKKRSWMTHLGKQIIYLLRNNFSGHSDKHFTLVNYNARGVPDLKIPHITTLES